MNPDSLAQQKREEEIERLATETARLIREAEPETREQLTELASTIIRQEARTVQDATQPVSVRRPMNPLAAGLGLAVVGAGLAFIVPFLGVAVLVCGAVAVLWGIIISWVRE
ncbi:MAG: hypothetical protein ACREQ7_09225 [Candidatus Binatia bacterium]